MRKLFVILGTVCVALGILGIFLPLLPTTPFLLLAASLYFKSSRKLYDRLIKNKYLGRYISNFRTHKAIPMPTKILAVSLMVGMMMFSAFYVVEAWWLRIVLMTVMVGVGYHILSYKTLTRQMMRELGEKETGDGAKAKDMTIEEIKAKLARKAVKFETGGFRPANPETESWIGRVYLYAENEDIPVDDAGRRMYPLFQLCLDGLPFVPDSLMCTKAITVFVSAELPMDLTPNNRNWVLREYGRDDELTVRDLSNPESYIKPFPLKPVLIEEDYPVWDSGDIPADIEKAILDLEESEGVDYYDMIENIGSHKIGGYPAYVQSGIDFGKGFEFVFQIASDEKAHFNVVDNGNIYLAKNAETGEWLFYCDFH